MKRMFYNIALLAAVGCFLAGCGGDGEVVFEKGYEPMGYQANKHFVYLWGDEVLFTKRIHRAESAKLCDKYKQTECEVYMWDDKKNIPKKLPIRTQSMYTRHALFMRDSEGKKDYKYFWTDEEEEAADIRMGKVVDKKTGKYKKKQ